jgi:hypothetical protein
MFYRPGGTSKAINRQYDSVYSDAVGGATGWLPVHKGDTIAVNICRASITFGSAATSKVAKSPNSPECSVLMELKMFGGDPDTDAWPVDKWQNLVVATSRVASRDGWVRLRLLNVNSQDGTGVAMAMQVSRTGNTGMAT